MIYICTVNQDLSVQKFRIIRVRWTLGLNKISDYKTYYEHPEYRNSEIQSTPILVLSTDNLGKQVGPRSGPLNRQA